MRIAKTNVLMLLATAVTLTVVSLFACYTAKWARMHRSHAARAQSEQLSGQVIQGSLPGSPEQPSEPSVRSGAMAEAFRGGRLPSPLPIRTGNPDDAAADLAKRIAAADEQSTGALMTVIQMAGFTIRGEDGVISVKPDGATQGMAFDAFSVAAMAKLYNDRWTMSLADLSIVLGKAIPAIQKEDVSGILLKGVASAAQGDQPLRFWAHTIIELGHQAEPSYDLLDPKLDPATVQLNAIQVSFILQRLAGDLWAHAQPGKPATNAFNRSRPSRSVRLQMASFHPSSNLGLILVDDSGSALDSPCTEGANTMLDGIAILESTEWEKIVDIAKAAEEGVPLLARANAVIAILRFIYIYSGMNIKITMDNPPLVRTYDLDKGKSRTLTAHVWFEIKGWPCAVWMLARASLLKNGLDLGNLPNNGAAEGVGVEWELIDGGVPKNVTTRNLALFLEAQRSAIVMFDNGAGSDGATWNKETDDEGNSTIKISGRPQQVDMTNMKRIPIDKKMSVLVNIAYTHNGAANKMLGEFVDVLGPAAGFTSGDLLGGLVGGITETLFRMHWYSSNVFDFQVTDWIPCSKGWGGTITYTQSLHTIQQVKPSTMPGLSSSGYQANDLKRTGVLTLSGGEMLAPGFYESAMIWSEGTSRSALDIAHSSAKNGCGPVIEDLTTQLTLSGSGKADGKAEVSRAADGTYGIQVTDLRSGTYNARGNAVNKVDYVAREFDVPTGACTSRDSHTNDVRPADETEGLLFVTISGSSDAKQPDEIHDTQVVTDLVTGAKTQFTVDLIRCDK